MSDAEIFMDEWYNLINDHVVEVRTIAGITTLYFGDGSTINYTDPEISKETVSD